MKNFKEKILKIGKRKNCFIALLLVALIAFGIVTGLKGSNSANSGAIKANAFTEVPQPKNLDLNGIRYTYQTSLNELKNNYKMFYAPYQNHYISITTTPDEETAIEIEMVDRNNDYTEEVYNSNKDAIKNNIEFYFNNEKFDYTVGTLNVNQTYPLSSSPQYVFNEINNFNNITQIQIDFNGLQQNIFGFYPNYTGYLVQFYYITNNFNPSESENINYIYENSIIYSYVLSNPTKFKFELPKIDNYNLTNILIISGDDNSEVDPENYLQAYTLNSVFSLQSLESVYSRYYCIEDLKLITNNNANIASFKMNISTNNSPVYQGNLLLSNKNYDKSFINDIANGDSYGSVPINGNLFWGGNVNNNPPSYSSNGSIVFYAGRNTASLDAWYRTVYSSAGQMQPFGAGFGNITYGSEELYGAPTNNYRIYYENQSRLIFLSKTNTLTGTYKETQYDGLSIQVEDILFNVQYIGDIEENERKERIEEDFNNLLKTVGLGAFIGLLIGILIGNPALGLIWGAFIGLAVGIMPLLIDGLQAIFGNDFLSGLYDFFKQITEFFVNIVDTIIEFLMNIITNPFILILIVIVAIIYIVKRYNK